MKYICLFILLFTSTTYAKQPSELMLMGTFHFENPGLDKVKATTINVMSKENQEYLIQLSHNISRFKPSIVLLEFHPDNTDKINSEYQKYLTGDFELKANEIYQIGFRVAKLSGVQRIESLDERSIQWQAEELFKYMQTQDLEANAEIQAMIEDITKKTNENHESLTLKQILQLNNDESYDQINKSIYLATNSVAVDDGKFYGADASASWWHRNFRIYAKIQNYAKSNPRVFALAGQGHTAILKDFVKTDKKIKGVEIEF